MLLSIATLALAAQLGTAAPQSSELPVLQQAQYGGVPRTPPPCGHGWDQATDGMCYPNGYLAPQDQVARRYEGYRGGARSYNPGGRGTCGHGADLDVRDGRCYPNGAVPPQFQQGRQRQYGDGYYQNRQPQRGYYYED